MGNEANEALIRHYWQHIWNEGDLDAVAACYASDCRHGENFSIEKFQRNVARTRQAFPDFHVTVDDLFSVEDKVVSRVTYEGTHADTYAGLPASGKRINATGIDIYRISGGKIVEHWHEADHFTMFEQMGAVWRPGRY